MKIILFETKVSGEGGLSNIIECTVMLLMVCHHEATAKTPQEQKKKDNSSVL